MFVTELVLDACRRNSSRRKKMDVQQSLFPNEEKELEKRVEQKTSDTPLQKRLEYKRKEFEAKFKYGSTTVIYHNSSYYLWGDISHCGEENIFHNARVMRDEMLENQMPYGHMSYNDPPRYEKPKWKADWDFAKFRKLNSFWEWREWERKNIYRDDLFVFEEDEIVLKEKYEVI